MAHMFRFGKAVRAVVAGVATAGLLAGCSEAEPKAVPKLPSPRVCWGALAGSEVSPLLPQGDKVSIRARPFVLAESTDAVTCNVNVDGNVMFAAHATYWKFEDEVDWSPYDGAHPRPLDVGRKGIIWPGGAGTHFVCEPSTSSSDPGKYIELSINVYKPPDKEETQKALPKLLQEFLTFAERELKCPGASAKK
ncbi:hypothetical protein SLA_5714 [Streptomyces laurentii]|uniref:DUF3558 domain-containing protein n=1 Tax=Streptomyces laurentii TaxID=39478 RepID=A0A160P718_STRLU|nr:hypothetical protein SLA_5714 [Streptomyces laurentii]